MKKELCAGAIILLLIAGSILNVCYLDRLSSEITGQIRQSQEACEREDYLTAEQELRDALDLWLASDGYTHIFLRHSEIDGTSDAFYDALSYLTDEDANGAQGAYEKLLYHIDSIVSMEHVTPRSIL